MKNDSQFIQIKMIETKTQEIMNAIEELQGMLVVPEKIIQTQLNRNERVPRRSKLFLQSVYQIQRTCKSTMDRLRTEKQHLHSLHDQYQKTVTTYRIQHNQNECTESYKDLSVLCGELRKYKEATIVAIEIAAGETETRRPVVLWTTVLEQPIASCRATDAEIKIVDTTNAKNESHNNE